MAANQAAGVRKRSMRELLAAMRRPKVAAMFALGFASGLPFLLTGNTLGYWLRDEGATLKAIGFLSWVGIAYSLKFLWAPLIDHLKPPLLGALGQRRGWLLIAQVIVGIGLLAMAAIGPGGPGGLTMLGVFAVVVAFASATQDIVVDAWRIEAAADSDELGLLSAAFQLGYRAALLCTDALILIAANHLGWPISYVMMALCMSVGIAAAFAMPEPNQADAIMEGKERAAPMWTPRGLFDAIAGPFIAFFKTHGPIALGMLLMISIYRLPDFLMGPMANPFYHDLGFSKDVVGYVRGSIGLTASLFGIAAGGLCAVRFGYLRTLTFGAVLQALSVLSFSGLALAGPDIRVFGAVMAVDSFGVSFAGVALVTYMSSLTSIGYTATQYALLTSTYALAGKFLKGFSGVTVEGLAAQHGLMPAYAIFFAMAASIGIPTVLMIRFLAARQARPPTAQAA